MAKSIGGTLFVSSMEVVHFSESPLWEAPLYYAHLHTYTDTQINEAQ